jgi:predicted permease
MIADQSLRIGSPPAILTILFWGAWFGFTLCHFILHYFWPSPLTATLDWVSSLVWVTAIVGMGLALAWVNRKSKRFWIGVVCMIVGASVLAILVLLISSL